MRGRRARIRGVRVDEITIEGGRARVSAIGEAIGRAAQPGDVVALVGALGAGKTFFTQAVARGLGVPASARVTSPTFTVVQEHRGRIGLWHADLYRLAHPDELAEIGLLERGADGLVVVEWADRMPEVVPADALWVTLAVKGATRRALTLRGGGARCARLTARLEV